MNENKIGKSALAALMLQYEELNTQLQDIGDQIKDAVLSGEETVVVGNVRATYNSGRKTYDWQKYAYEYGIAPLAEQFKTVIDWKAVCEGGGLSNDKAPILKQADPSVTVKVKR